jgi:hypothetical protein
MCENPVKSLGSCIVELKNRIPKGTKKEAALFGAASRKIEEFYLFNN